MSGFQVGDYVLVRAKVVEVHGGELGYSVELFSKTDQYAAWVRPDLVMGKTDPPPQPEPDREYLVKDRDGDIWRWDTRQSAWHCVTEMSTYVRWHNLLANHGPVTIYGDIS